MLAVYDMKDLRDVSTWDLSREGKTPRDIGIEPMLETPLRLEMGQVLIIEGVAYAVCSLSSRANTQLSAYVTRLKLQDVFAEGDDPQTLWDSNQLKCPFCGTVFEDTYEMEPHEDEYECCICGSTFSYEQQVSVTYDIVPGERSEARTFSTSEEEVS